MSKKYIVGKYKLTVMQHAVYRHLNGCMQLQSIEQITQGVFSPATRVVLKNGKYKEIKVPNIYTLDEKKDKVEKWCKALVNLNIIKQDGSNFYCA